MTNIETRVGYVTLTILKEQLKDYVMAHTDKQGVFIGDLNYLLKLEDINKYLNRSGINEDNQNHL